MPPVGGTTHDRVIRIAAPSLPRRGSNAAAPPSAQRAPQRPSAKSPPTLVAQGNRILKSQHPHKVRLTERGTKALRFDAALARLLAKEIERDVPDDGHMLRRITGTYPTGIFMKHHVKHPMHAMFDAPMPAHHIVDGCGCGHLIEQEVPLFNARRD